MDCIRNKVTPVLEVLLDEILAQYLTILILFNGAIILLLPSNCKINSGKIDRALGHKESF
jgi:hypothetical protein